MVKVVLRFSVRWNISSFWSETSLIATIHADELVTPDADIAYALESTWFTDRIRIKNWLDKNGRILAEPFNDGSGDHDVNEIEKTVMSLNLYYNLGD